MARRAAKVDRNHSEIAEAFRALGCSVTSTHMVGEGFPDLVCAYGLHTFCVEVKDPEQPSSARQFTPAQKRWHAAWTGKAHVVETVEQVAQIVNDARCISAAMRLLGA